MAKSLSLYLTKAAKRGGKIKRIKISCSAIGKADKKAGDLF